MKRLFITGILLAVFVSLLGISDTAYARERAVRRIEQRVAGSRLREARKSPDKKKRRPAPAPTKPSRQKPSPKKPSSPKKQVISAKSEISVKKGVAILRGCLVLKQANRIRTRLQLQQLAKGKWVTLKSWNSSFSPRKTLNVKQSMKLKKGYKYRLYITFTIENGKTIKVSRVVKY